MTRPVRSGTGACPSSGVGFGNRTGNEPVGHDTASAKIPEGKGQSHAINVVDWGRDNNGDARLAQLSDRVD
jgi:hypothetical protein